MDTHFANMRSLIQVLSIVSTYFNYGSFTLTETDSGTDLDSDSKPDGYIVLCTTLHRLGLRFVLPISTGIRVQICTEVRLQHM